MQSISQEDKLYYSHRTDTYWVAKYAESGKYKVPMFEVHRLHRFGSDPLYKVWPGDEGMVIRHLDYGAKLMERIKIL